MFLFIKVCQMFNIHQEDQRTITQVDWYPKNLLEHQLRSALLLSCRLSEQGPRLQGRSSNRQRTRSTFTSPWILSTMCSTNCKMPLCTWLTDRFGKSIIYIHNPYLCWYCNIHANNSYIDLSCNHSNGEKLNAHITFYN